MSLSLSVDAALTAGADPLTPRPKGVAEAARQFEALLIRQMLQSARGDEPGWFGSGGGAGSATAADLAEEHFARAMSQSGGLGLSAQIVASLSRGSQPRGSQKLQLCLAWPVAGSADRNAPGRSGP
jgi:flagellar protein FlgJ